MEKRIFNMVFERMTEFLQIILDLILGIENKEFYEEIPNLVLCIENKEFYEKILDLVLCLIE